MRKIKNHNPYIGLRSFSESEEDIDRYQGYFAIAKHLRELVRKNNISLLVAPSGTGKSSFVNAEFIPYLREDSNSWIIRKMEPKKHARSNFCIKLLEFPKLSPEKLISWGFDDWLDYAIDQCLILSNNNDMKRILFIVDQFEEIFTRNKEKNPEWLIKILIEVSRIENISILLVSRLDYLNNFTQFEGFFEELNENTIFLPSLPSAQIKNAITKPLDKINKYIDTELLDHLNKETLKVRTKGTNVAISNKGDSLSLLQYYLFQMWNKFADVNDELTTDHYLKLGPFEKIIDRVCDDVYYFSEQTHEDICERQERHMTKYLFQFVAKQDKFNPKKLVRNPKTLNEICELYNSIFHNETPKLLPHSSNDKKTTERYWTKLVEKYIVQEIGILRKKEENVNGDKIIKIDVMHETVFRQWYRCNEWIEKKNEIFDEFNRLIKNEKKSSLKNKLISFNHLIDIWEYLEYFESQLWREQFFEYTINEEAKRYASKEEKLKNNNTIRKEIENGTDKYKQEQNHNKIAEKYYFIKDPDYKYNPKYIEEEERYYMPCIARMYRQRYFRAIKRADFYTLIYIKHYNYKYKNLKIRLGKDELEHREFDKEFYFALDIGNDPKFKKESGNKKASDVFKNAAYQDEPKRPNENENDVKSILLRWIKDEKYPVKKLMDMANTNPTDSVSHSHLYEFAAFGGNLEYLKALMYYVYEDQSNQFTKSKFENKVGNDVWNEYDLDLKFNKKFKDPGIFTIGTKSSALNRSVFGGEIKVVKEIFKSMDDKNRRKVLLLKSPLNERTVFHSALPSIGIDKKHIVKEEDKNNYILNWLIDKALKLNKSKPNKKLAKPLTTHKDENEWLPIHTAVFQAPEQFNNPFDQFPKGSLIKKTKEGFSPFFLACLFKNEFAVKNLLSSVKNKSSMLVINEKSDFNSKNYLLAIMINNLKSIGPNVTTNKLKYDLFKSLLEGEKEVRNQINVKSLDNGLTLLHYCNWFSFDVIKLMLVHSADPNISSGMHSPLYYLPEEDRYSSLDYAVIWRGLNIVKLFFSESAEIKVDQSTLYKAAKLAYKLKKHEIYNFLNQQIKEEEHQLTEFTFSYGRMEHNYNQNIGFERLNDSIKLSDESQWGVPPLYGNNEDWTELKKKDLEQIISLNANLLINNTFEAKPKFIKIRSKPLAFYKNVQIAEVLVQYSHINKFVLFTCLINENKEVTHLNGTSPPIHQINAKLPIKLTKKDTYDYFKFFNSAVHGEEGAFKIIEDVKDVHWLNEAEKEKVKNLVQMSLKQCNKPVQHRGKEFWTCTALVNHSNALFLADYKIFKSGMIEMLNDYPIISNLSVKVELFENGLRGLKKYLPDNEVHMIDVYGAAKEGLLELVKEFLIGNDAQDINNLNDEGKTLFDIAVDEGHLGIMNWLLIENRKNDFYISKENVDKAKEILALNADEISNSQTNRTEIIRLLERKMSETIEYNRLRLVRLNDCIKFSDEGKWSVPPLYGNNEDWTELTEKDLEDIISLNSDLLIKTTFNAGLKFIKIRSIAFSFYDSVQLVEILVQHSHVNKFVLFTCLVNENKEVKPLNGTSTPIHQINAKLPIKLTIKNAYDYFKFFNSAVHGEEGAFKIIEDMEDVHWLNEAERGKVKKLIQISLRQCKKPIQQKGREFWACTALVNYSNALFLADYKIFKSGMIEMLNDYPIMSNLSLKVELFENGLRGMKESLPHKDGKMQMIDVYEAAKGGLLELMKELIIENDDKDINKSNNEGKTLFDIAVDEGHLGIMNWLLIENKKNNFFISKKYIEKAKKIVALKINESSNTNYTEMIKLLEKKVSKEK